MNTLLVSPVNDYSKLINVSVGICANNEESNIAKLLDALLKQKTSIANIVQILVVSCSNDGTNEIVTRYHDRDDRICLIIQQTRKGKAAAVNLFLNQAIGDVLVLESADTLPEEWTIEKLVEPFSDSCIGMTGGHPIPTNNVNEVMGYTSNLLWQMHHEVSISDPENPKCGELVAFRNIIKSIPENTAVDEAWIEREEKQKGLSLYYAKDAIVYNHGPETINDFLKQRRRIHTGHLHLMRCSGYSVSTMRPSKVIKVVPKVLGINLTKMPYFISALFLEGYSRLLGNYDFYVRKKNPYVWEMVESTKEV